MSLRRSIAALALLAFVSIMGGLAQPRPTAALEPAFRPGAAADTLTVSPQNGSLPKYRIRRSGPREITVTFAAGRGGKAPALPRLRGGKLVSGVQPVKNGFKIRLKTKAFSYVNSADAAGSRLKIQIFRDNVGTLWTPPRAGRGSAAERTTAAKARTRRLTRRAPPAKRGGAGETGRRPVRRPPQPAALRKSRSGAAAAPPSGARRTPPRVQGAAPRKPPRSAVHPRLQHGGNLPAGVKERPILQERTLTNLPPQAGTKPAPPPHGPVVDVVPARGRRSVFFRAERRGPADARPARVISGRPARGRRAAARRPAPRPWEMRSRVQKTLTPNAGAAKATLPRFAGTSGRPPAAAARQGTPQAGQPPKGPTAAQGNPGAGRTPHPAAPPAAAKTPPAPPVRKSSPAVEALKNELLSAQTDVVAGKLPDALKKLEGILRNPAARGDVREEALYSRADALMQQDPKHLAANFENIAGAQLAAINSNPKSRRVPRALVNLGLLNLKVGNFREALAYFGVLQKKYPHDEHTAMMPYALGEYYRSRGDLNKAADQYQRLIQEFPDSRMSKSSAYVLAQILRKLGDYKQAYQIVDYIGKRWPLFSMEAPAFLRLAGDVEEKTGRLEQAKDHYWTYYNILPKDPLADITLVRIGDIYLRENKPKAAKEIYQKVVHDFPNREGALAARMRLAEAGIYDDPTMKQMTSVFSQPQVPRPNETYRLIMTRYPQSPLAPLAALKLAMWQFYSKSYIDALNTAGTFLKRYPKNPLAGRARDMGFQAFLLGLPQLVREGDYARVMQLYDASPFVRDSHAKIGDEAQMAIAVSAWKSGQPDRALKLAGRFLGRRMVPKYSPTALDLAMNIFVQRKDWKRVADLAARANRLWKLAPQQKARFEHDRAMALENLGQGGQSLPLWTKIAANPKSDPSARAQATYVLARAAARKNDMHRLFALSQSALNQLLATHGAPAKVKDCLLMSITATERSGRYGQAIKWSSALDRVIPPRDPDWAPVRLRLAELYRRGGRMGEWRTILQDIIRKKPKTIYSRMASQALETNALDQRLQNYLPRPQPQPKRP